MRIEEKKERSVPKITEQIALTLSQIRTVTHEIVQFLHFAVSIVLYASQGLAIIRPVVFGHSQPISALVFSCLYSIHVDVS